MDAVEITVFLYVQEAVERGVMSQTNRLILEYFKFNNQSLSHANDGMHHISIVISFYIIY